MAESEISDRVRALAIAQAVADELLGRAAKLYQDGSEAAGMYHQHAVGAATVVNALKAFFAEGGRKAESREDDNG